MRNRAFTVGIQVTLGSWANTSRIELGVTLTIVAMLLMFAVVSYTGFQETQDASVVQSVHTALQSTVAQAAARQHVPAMSLGAQNVINAIKLNMPTSVTLRATGLSTTPFEMTFPASDRKAYFSIEPNGDVRIKGLAGNWTRFNAANGVIEKN